jgi:uncharacterized protein (DUF2336 family)
MTLPRPKELNGKRYLSEGRVAQRYDVDPRTIRRRRKDLKVNFPEPDIEINGRGYTSETTLDAFDEQQEHLQQERLQRLQQQSRQQQRQQARSGNRAAEHGIAQQSVGSAQQRRLVRGAAPQVDRSNS